MNAESPKKQLTESTKNSLSSREDWIPLEPDRFFASGNKEFIWNKYCGFLKMNVKEFMIIQKLLLMEQIEMTADSIMGKAILGERQPADVEEFRKFTPLTIYSDYQPELGSQDAAALASAPLFWIESTGRSGCKKQVPVTLETIKAVVDDAITALILSSASSKGEVILKPQARMILDLPSDLLSAAVVIALNQRLPSKFLPQPRKSINLVYQNRINHGINLAFSAGLDFVATSPEMLNIIAANIDIFTRLSRLSNWYPEAIWRILKAKFISLFAKRDILPKDIWKLKGLISFGSDPSLDKVKIYEEWGVQPLDVYCATETCFMAVQAWNKRGLNLLPYRHFYEFIGKAERDKEKANADYQPTTLLINELKQGEIYELVVTNFHGGPFIRYRIGDLLKVIALQDNETGVLLPQFKYYGRTDRQG
jgi:hypothetical protein